MPSAWAASSAVQKTSTGSSLDTFLWPGLSDIMGTGGFDISRKAAKRQAAAPTLFLTVCGDRVAPWTGGVDVGAAGRDPCERESAAKHLFGAPDGADQPGDGRIGGLLGYRKNERPAEPPPGAWTPSPEAAAMPEVPLPEPV